MGLTETVCNGTEAISVAQPESKPPRDVMAAAPALGRQISTESKASPGADPTAGIPDLKGASFTCSNVCLRLKHLRDPKQAAELISSLNAHVGEPLVDETVVEQLTLYPSENAVNEAVLAYFGEGKSPLLSSRSLDLLIGQLFKDSSEAGTSLLSRYLAAWPDGKAVNKIVERIFKDSDWYWVSGLEFASPALAVISQAARSGDAYCREALRSLAEHWLGNSPWSRVVEKIFWSGNARFANSADALDCLKDFIQDRGVLQSVRKIARSSRHPHRIDAAAILEAARKLDKKTARMVCREAAGPNGRWQSLIEPGEERPSLGSSNWDPRGRDRFLLEGLTLLHEAKNNPIIVTAVEEFLHSRDENKRIFAAVWLCESQKVSADSAPAVAQAIFKCDYGLAVLNRLMTKSRLDCKVIFSLRELTLDALEASDRKGSSDLFHLLVLEKALKISDRAVGKSDRLIGALVPLLQHDDAEVRSKAASILEPESGTG